MNDAARLALDAIADHREEVESTSGELRDATMSTLIRASRVLDTEIGRHATTVDRTEIDAARAWLHANSLPTSWRPEGS